MTAQRVWFPALLGVIATAGNYLLIAQYTTTHEVVMVRGTVKAGAPLTELDLAPVAVRGDKALFVGTVPWVDRNVLVGLAPRRSLKEGELVLRADLETEANQFQEPPPGFESLTLTVRRAALVAPPPPGAHVRPGPGKTAAPPTLVYGPYQFLGWVAPPPVGGREAEVVQVAVAVPAAAGVREAELRAAQEAGAAERVVQVEVVGRVR